MPIKITYYVHGTTFDNELDNKSGWNNVQLSKLGIQQVKDLKIQTDKQKFDIIYCSDLQRAIDTANLGFKKEYLIKQDKRLREVNYGDLNAKHKSEFPHDDQFYIDNVFPNGESFKDVEKRMISFIKFLKQNYDNKHIAIVAHKAPQLSLDVLLKDKTWEQAIKEDWRLDKKWQAGWKYSITD